jgi:formylglycine-generating enzyme required for sulfatase activity
VRQWRAYACDVAAAYAIALLKSGPVPLSAPATAAPAAAGVTGNTVPASEAKTPSAVSASARQPLGFPARQPQPRVPTAPPDIPAWVPELVHVPAGPFRMGSSAADKLASDDERPQHRLELPVYWMGKTPVTNAQFQPFVEGEGYTNSKYWIEAGWQWRQSEKLVKPRYWDDSQWNDADYPVVGVSWYEAVAYCRWLSAQTGQEFRLPSEAEWEKTARGADGRIWPWGNAWEQRRCNTKEAGLGKTTPVGQYPAGASPYVALDMAGNVYEWWATRWRKSYPYQIEDEWQAVYLAANNRPVLRGGSWYDEQKHVRASYRVNIDPRTRRGGIGLRVASHARPGAGS